MTEAFNNSGQAFEADLDDVNLPAGEVPKVSEDGDKDEEEVSDNVLDGVRLRVLDGSTRVVLGSNYYGDAWSIDRTS